MEAQAASLVLRFFRDLPDPRRENARHRLMDILTIAILAVLSGADDVEAIAEYGIDEQDWLRTFLTLPHGIPSPSTFRRVLRRLDPQALHRCFVGWVRELVKNCHDKQIAIDGKALRRSFDHAWKKLGLHLVSAWCVEDRLVLGQVAADAKSNEITAVPELLGMLAIQGAVVTVDALNCQKDIARHILDGGADYLMAVKDNHPLLHQEIQKLMHEAWLEKSPLLHASERQVAQQHGRKEVRRIWSSSELLPWISQRGEWPGLRSLVMVQSRRKVLTEAEPKTEWRYFISSLPGEDVERLAKLIRGHWGVENGLHWGLDISFREDDSRLHKDHGAENMSVLRRIALNVLKQDRTCRLGVKNKRLKAARNRGYLLSVLTQASAAK